MSVGASEAGPCFESFDHIYIYIYVFIYIYMFIYIYIFNWMVYDFFSNINMSDIALMIFEVCHHVTCIVFM